MQHWDWQGKRVAVEWQLKEFNIIFMELKQLKTENYPNNSIVVDFKIIPENLMQEVNARLNELGLKVIQYETFNDSICFVITKNKTKGIKELETTIFYDLEALKDKFITGDKEDFNYHFDLLKGNLKDFFKKY